MSVVRFTNYFLKVLFKFHPYPLCAAEDSQQTAVV